jgi:hypothetical protein
LFSVKEEFVREMGSQKYGIKRDEKRNKLLTKGSKKINDRSNEEIKRVKEVGARTQRKQGRYKGKREREKDGNIRSTEKINERKDGIKNKNKELSELSGVFCDRQVYRS